MHGFCRRPTQRDLCSVPGKVQQLSSSRPRLGRSQVPVTCHRPLATSAISLCWERAHPRHRWPQTEPAISTHRWPQATSSRVQMGPEICCRTPRQATSTLPSESALWIHRLAPALKLCSLVSVLFRHWGTASPASKNQAPASAHWWWGWATRHRHREAGRVWGRGISCMSGTQGHA